MMTGRGGAGRKGQIVLVLAFALAALAVLALLNVDTLLMARGRFRSQNCGDAAAIAAARRQGDLLNEIGRLNIAHIAAAAIDDTNECRRIVRKQRSLALCGPLLAIRDASEAARKYPASAEDSRTQPFSGILRDHAEEVRNVYSGGGAGDRAYPEPYPGAWTEYASAIENEATGNLCAIPDCLEYYYSNGDHVLMRQDFYSAVDSKNWCWFLLDCPMGNLLENERYSSYRDWPPLPRTEEEPRARFQNCEYFPLGVAAEETALDERFSIREIATLLERYSGESVPEDRLEKSALIKDPEEPWFFFEPHKWRIWMIPGETAKPLAGDIKEEYNVRGASATVRCRIKQKSVLGDDGDFDWPAAAKPFGTVVDFEGKVSTADSLRRFVVPCFSDVRLVALGMVSDGRNTITADRAWIAHVREHLEDYLERGPSLYNNCKYCESLARWENPFFRKEGELWLKMNPGQCNRGSPGPGGWGGDSYGH